jgi:hypothetical protein
MIDYMYLQNLTQSLNGHTTIVRTRNKFGIKSEGMADCQVISPRAWLSIWKGQPYNCSSNAP